MSDGFYTMLGIVLPVLIVQVAQIVQQARNNKKAEEAQKTASVAREGMASNLAALSNKVEDLHQTTQAIVAQVDKP